MVINTHMWGMPSEKRKLRENEVHVWKARLDVSTTRLSFFQEMLSSEENAKVRRFYFDRDRHRWAVARGLLRSLLGHYMQTDPEHPQEVERWSMQQLAPDPGYAGALTVEGVGWQLQCWQWLN